VDVIQVGLPARVIRPGVIIVAADILVDRRHGATRPVATIAEAGTPGGQSVKVTQFVAMIVEDATLVVPPVEAKRPEATTVEAGILAAQPVLGRNFSKD
jgi:hypothetical protein